MSIARTGDVFRSRKTRGTYYVSTKGGTSREAASEAVFQQRAEFAFVTHLIKNPCAADIDAATAISRGTMYLPRDMLAKAAYGTLLEVHTDDGRYLGSSREAARDGQLLLATISQARTSIVYRGENDWAALITTKGNDVLHIKASPRMPDWYYRVVGYAELQTTLDQMGADVGDVIVRGKSEWSIVKPGANGTVLVSGGPNGVPCWVEGYVVMSDAQSVLDSVTNVPGSILYRAADKWVGLAAGASGDVLTVDPTTGLPVWLEPRLTVDQLRKALDLLSSAEGSMLVRTADGWGALEPGTSGYALVSQGTGKMPIWAEVSGGGGVISNCIDLFDPPLAADFSTIINGDGVSPAPSVNDNASVGMTLDAGLPASGKYIRGAMKSVTATTHWSLIFRMRYTTAGGSFRAGGVAVSDGTKIVMLGIGNISDEPRIVIYDWATFTGERDGIILERSCLPWEYGRFEWNGSALTISISADAVNWSIVKTNSYLSGVTLAGPCCMPWDYDASTNEKNYVLVPYWKEENE